MVSASTSIDEIQVHQISKDRTLQLGQSLLSNSADDAFDLLSEEGNESLFDVASVRRYIGA